MSWNPGFGHGPGRFRTSRSESPAVTNVRGRCYPAPTAARVIPTAFSIA